MGAVVAVQHVGKFQPALPMRGVTRPQLLGTVNIVISTRTPHAGSDAALTFLWVVSPFQPALPMRGVTNFGTKKSSSSIFQPALPMRGVTLRPVRVHQGRHISTRTPHAGSDAEVAAARNGDNKFQPALPMRGVTGHRVCMHESVSISTRTPHAGSDIVFAAHITH